MSLVVFVFLLFVYVALLMQVFGAPRLIGTTVVLALLEMLFIGRSMHRKAEKEQLLGSAESATVCAFTMVFLGDIPRQQLNAGLKQQGPKLGSTFDESQQEAWRAAGETKNPPSLHNGEPIQGKSPCLVFVKISACRSLLCFHFELETVVLIVRSLRGFFSQALPLWLLAQRLINCCLMLSNVC